MPVLATYTEPAEAHIVAGMLQSHGLHPVIQQGAMSSLYPAPLSGSFPIAVLIPQAEEQEALALLRQHHDD